MNFMKSLISGIFIYSPKGGRVMEECLFCKIISGEIPSDKVYEDEFVYVFNDIDKQAPEHFLIIPKEHIASADELEEEHKTLIGHI